MSTKSKLLYLLLVGILLLQACGIGQTNLSEEDARKEIVSFVLNFIVTEEIGGIANYITTSSQPWVDSPPDASIIVYAPPKKNGGDSLEYLDYKNPIIVWWYADDKLTEANDKQKAIDEYHTKYIDNATGSGQPVWDSYDFGIMKISADHQSAEVYVGATCGPTCGHGVMYKIKRNANGEWEIYDSEVLWVS